MEQEGSKFLTLPGDALTEVNLSSPRNQISVKMGKPIVQGGHQQRDIFSLSDHWKPEEEESKNHLLQPASCHDDILKPTLNNSYFDTQHDWPDISNCSCHHISRNLTH